MIPCTLINDRRRLDVDLHALPVPGTEIGGCLSTLTLRVERVQQWPVRSGGRVRVWVSVPGPLPIERPAVLNRYWDESGWTECGCGR